MAKRADVLTYAKSQYGSEAESLWPKYPDDVVLRHSDNDGAKWYALLMKVIAKKLGLDLEGKVDIMNLKCQPDVVDFLLEQDGIFPAYHMNKTHWITVLLNDEIETEKVLELLDNSYKLTAKKTKNKKS